MTHQHIKLSRDEPVTDRHRAQRIVPKFIPANPREFGRELLTKLVAAEQRIVADIGGFDNRRLLKIVLREGEVMPLLETIPGIEIVSQEEKTVVLAFASEEGLQAFEARLTTLAQSGVVNRKEIFYAIEDFDRWTSEDRKGNALRSQGFPERQTFTLDIELWPLEATNRRIQMLEAFVQWAQLQGIEILDRLIQPSLVMLRVQTSSQLAGAILEHRDVRTVDLPPRLGVSVEMLFTDINQFAQTPAPDADVPHIVVLDSGLTSNHPLIAPAVGEAQGFVEPDRSASDNVPHGHGTFVAGLALYGDIEANIRSGEFVPGLRLFSGKVFNDDGDDQHEFVERAVEEAVRYFFDTYQCRVFNLSYGDLNKIYDGRHVRGLAYTLDRLTRELGVLFVVPTGNLDIPDDPRATYPDYLLRDEAKLLDPATALNVITVGGLTRHTASRDAQQHQNHIEDLPIATEGQPAPFTRSGMSVGGAIKPDFVDEAGNAAVMRASGRIRYHGLGLVSLQSGFAGGGVFREGFGTSFAAPIVAHKAARLVGKFPDGSVNLARAMLAVHARWPHATVQLLNPENNATGKSKVLRLAGYGKVDDAALFDSLDQVVTLYSEEHIEHDKHHFYELPVPDEFWSQGRRTRTLSIALAYSPEVRTTRLDYKRTKLSFTLVSATSLEAATTAFTHGRDDGLSERATSRTITGDDRKPGTLQMSQWKFKLPLKEGNKFFVVVTRQDANWSTAKDELESYALAIVLNDEENAVVNLYDRISLMLQARVQLRARARV
jgi:hypothetical protein